MKGVQFGDFHSFAKWGLILSKKEIGTPAVKEKKVDIEGADGELDYTESFGGVKYGNRLLKFEFQCGGISAAEFLPLVSQIQDTIHGNVFEVVIDDDSDWYYEGRCKVADFTQEKGILKIFIEVNAKPYKRKRIATNVSQTVTEGADIVLNNSRMPVVPTITTDSEMKFTFDGNTYSVGAGTFRIPQLQIKQGENLVTVAGNGKVTFEYREGRL